MSKRGDWGFQENTKVRTDEEGSKGGSLVLIYNVCSSSKFFGTRPLAVALFWCWDIQSEIPILADTDASGICMNICMPDTPYMHTDRRLNLNYLAVNKAQWEREMGFLFRCPSLNWSPQLTEPRKSINIYYHKKQQPLIPDHRSHIPHIPHPSNGSSISSITEKENDFSMSFISQPGQRAVFQSQFPLPVLNLLFHNQNKEKISLPSTEICRRLKRTLYLNLELR